MRYSIIFILVCCLKLLSHAQYFNNRYDFSLQQDGALSIVEVSDGYVTAGVGEDSSSYDAIGILKIDFEGNELWKKSYTPALYHGYYSGNIGAFIKTSDGGFLMTGDITDTTGNSNVYLFKFDSNGDSLWFSEIDLGTRETVYQCIESDDSYLVIGFKYPSTGTADMLLLKTDISGSYLWHQTYGGSLWERGNTVIPCYDGGYILGGYSNSFTIDNNYDNFVVKTDSLGNEEWSKTFGGPFGDASAHVIQTLDSNYVVASKITKYELSGYPQSKARLIKIDSIGSIIWSKEYGSAELGGGLLSVKELCDGNILALGQGNDGLGSPSPANGYPHGVLLKTNSEGDSLWYNIYEHCTELEAQNYLRHFTPTSDDGIVACGFVSPGATCGGTQDMWIIKLDGDGNETGFKPITSEKGLMSVYPNPATGKFSIKVTNINANHCISLYNQLGVKIKETKVMNELTTVNVSHLPNGIYFLQVGEETKKFVVSR